MWDDRSWIPGFTMAGGQGQDSYPGGHQDNLVESGSYIGGHSGRGRPNQDINIIPLAKMVISLAETSDRFIRERPALFERGKGVRLGGGGGGTW
jgi:hypothetical protein